jgi:hypothetical protein
MPLPDPTTTTILTAIGVGSVAIINKLMARNEAARPDYATSAEFHQGMDAVRQEFDALRDKIDSCYITLSEKIETSTATVHARLTQIESAIIRIEQRTK